jgi:hypothetical protein
MIFWNQLLWIVKAAQSDVDGIRQMETSVRERRAAPAAKTSNYVF